MTKTSELDILSSRKTGFNLFSCCIPKDVSEDEDEIIEPESAPANALQVQDRDFDLPNLQEEPAPAQKQSSSKTNNVMYSLLELILSLFLLNMRGEKKMIMKESSVSTGKKNSEEQEETEDDSLIPDLVINS
mmetsp:Transcript_4527/g.6526  ORF Transcript_4527/g.6526 Transcript_4527/m.6526 type:complete len:132 (+) Transcript_4527:82-477(+)|eukprot:CAMPEP_0194200576 /NCGR_PEP_ID=MMETSP0156-20130528/1121_1 /TAXON_ID=33649 /ORGANISM="Thalassionema nitzschioides, Strain L26-B" /LENGTH=131 /DNA_ID=CAMNT_0038925587 /DNA_START=61 /DNA_END=456 /DNA_ORIENTATION=+